LFSPSSAGCSTNLVVLTHSTVTARGCAVFSVVAHTGVGMIVLGAVLLLGSFVLAVRNRRHGATPRVDVPASAQGSESVASTRATEPLPAGLAAPRVAEVPMAAEPVVAEPVAAEPVIVERLVLEPAVEVPVSSGAVGHGPEADPAAPRRRPIAPGEDWLGDRGDDAGSIDPVVRLPPGWYGNPNNPDRPVQWWDGTKLVDRPG
jgi:hypothetical protein